MENILSDNNNPTIQILLYTESSDIIIYAKN